MVPEWKMAAYERLRAEIVKSAAHDYQKALRKSDRLGFICEEQTKLEDWFLSKWGQFLSGDNGEYIVERCRKTYKARKFKTSKNKLPDDVQKKICEDYKNGMRLVDISKKHKVHVQTISTALLRWGT